MALAHVERPPGQAPRLRQCDYQPLGPDDDPAAVLGARLRQLNLDALPVCTALNPGEFTLQTLEIPQQIEADELRQAVRWRIKDRLDYDIEQAVIDVVDIPGQRERGRTPLIYVVAAHEDRVRRYVDLFEQAEAKLDCIDIPELAQRNIASLVPADAQGLALLSLASGSGLLTLTRDGVLYLAREFEQGVQALQLAPPAQVEGSDLSLSGMAPEQQRLLDSMVLEVQRSLDYYESHFAQPPINSLLLAPPGDSLAEVVPYLDSQLAQQVELLDLNTLLVGDAPLEPAMQGSCFTAIGLALREDSAEVA